MSTHFWRTHLADTYTPWVLFRHGTCIVGEVEGPTDDPAARAAEFLARYGVVHAGTDSGDFNVVSAPGGRLVTFYRPEMFVYVSHDEVGPQFDDLTAGLTGRARRAADAEAPSVAHAAVARAAPPPCACLDGPGRQLSPLRELGMDDHYAEASVLACRVCGRRWLRYFFENEAISRSGRWYLGHIPTAVALGITAPAAKRALEQAPYYFAGGSYYDGEIGRMAGKINL